MREYEMIIIARPTLDENGQNAMIEKYSNLINEHGKVQTIENKGLKELAYEVKKNKNGYSIVSVFESEPELQDELVRQLRIDDDVLKYFIVRKEG